MGHKQCLQIEEEPDTCFGMWGGRQHYVIAEEEFTPPLCVNSVCIATK